MINASLYCIGSARLIPAEKPDWRDRLPPAVKRRDPRIWQMAYQAAHLAIDDAGVHPRSIITATALGALDETCRFLDGIHATGFGSPRNFVASVHNSMAGRLAVLFDIVGPNITVCDGQNSLASAITTATLLSPPELPALVVAVDENTDLIARITPYISAECRRYLQPGWIDGAAAFILDSSAGRGWKITAYGPTPAGANPNKTCRSLGRNAAIDPTEFPDLQNASASFMQPAIELHKKINIASENKALIPTYSPAAHAAALVYAWI